MKVKFSDIAKMARRGNNIAMGLLLGDQRVGIGFNSEGKPTRFYEGKDLSDPANKYLLREVEDTRNYMEERLVAQMLGEGILPDEIIEAAAKIDLTKNSLAEAN